MKSFFSYFLHYSLKGFLVGHEFFSIPCCTFELNLKCIFDKLELLFLFPLHENIVALLNWKYFWQIGTPFSSFLLHENFVSKGKEQKKITGSEYEIRRKKKNQNIGAHFDLHCTMFANISEKVNRLTQS